MESQPWSGILRSVVPSGAALLFLSTTVCSIERRTVIADRLEYILYYIRSFFGLCERYLLWHHNITMKVDFWGHHIVKDVSQRKELTENVSRSISDGADTFLLADKSGFGPVCRGDVAKLQKKAPPKVFDFASDFWGALA